MPHGFTLLPYIGTDQTQVLRLLMAFLTCLYSQVCEDSLCTFANIVFSFVNLAAVFFNGNSKDLKHVTSPLPFSQNPTQLFK